MMISPTIPAVFFPFPRPPELRPPPRLRPSPSVLWNDPDLEDNSAAYKFDNCLVTLSSFVSMSLDDVTDINVDERAEDPLGKI